MHLRLLHSDQTKRVQINDAFLHIHNIAAVPYFILAEYFPCHVHIYIHAYSIIVIMLYTVEVLVLGVVLIQSHNFDLEFICNHYDLSSRLLEWCSLKKEPFSASKCSVYSVGCVCMTQILRTSKRSRCQKYSIFCLYLQSPVSCLCGCMFSVFVCVCVCVCARSRSHTSLLSVVKGHFCTPAIHKHTRDLGMRLLNFFPSVIHYWCHWGKKSSWIFIWTKTNVFNLFLVWGYTLSRLLQGVLKCHMCIISLWASLLISAEAVSSLNGTWEAGNWGNGILPE